MLHIASRRWCRLSFAIVLVGLLCAPAYVRAQDCAVSDRKDAGRICAHLAIEDGRLTVADVIVRQGSLPAAITPSVLKDRLNTALRQMGAVFLFAFQADERKDRDAALADAASNALRTARLEWTPYMEALSSWALDHDTDVTSVVDALQGAINRLGSETPFAGVHDPSGSLDAERGILRLDVFAIDAAPRIELPGVPDPAPRVRSLQKWLRPMEGELWEPGHISRRLSDYYSLLKLDAGVTANAGDAIEIIQRRRIARVLLPRDVTATERAELLYAVLPDPAFRYSRGRSAAVPAPGDEYEVWSYEDLGVPIGHEPYVRSDELQLEQLALAQLGFTLSTPPNTTRPAAVRSSYVDLVISRMDVGAQPADAPQPAPAVVDSTGLVNPQRQQVERTASFLNATTEAKSYKNYAGGGVSYAPDQGARVLLVAQRQRLPLWNSALGAQLAIGPSGLDPSLNYFADYIGFDRLGRRLSLQVNGSSDTRARRFLEGRFVDEQRSGAFVRAELEPFRDLAGSLLRLSLEGRRMKAGLSDAERPTSEARITAVDLGAAFLHRTQESLHQWSFSIEPTVRLAPEAGRLSYERLNVQAHVHLVASPTMQIDLSGRLGVASERTPVFELPTLGGAESVRGFRADDAVGRTVTSLQSEIWVPMPGFVAKPDSFVRQNVWIAAFADVGRSFSTVGGPAAVLKGAGVGARVRFNPLVIKADYAFGWGEAASPRRGAGRVYLLAETNLPF